MTNAATGDNIIGELRGGGGDQGVQARDCDTGASQINPTKNAPRAKNFSASSRFNGGC